MSIHIADYDPGWPRAFELEAERLRDAVGALALRIDHVGSTAVAGLAAKPVIDIQISVVDATSIEACRAPLEALGYTWSAVPFPYFHQPSAWPHTHHVHVREAGSEDELRTLAFRDWLRQHAPDRREYERLKRKLAAAATDQSPESRFTYSEGKTEFVRRVERSAKEGE